MKGIPKHFLPLIALWIFLPPLLLTCAEVTLVRNGNSSYRIVVSAEADSATLLAAREFSSYLQRVSGAALPISDDSTPPREEEVLIGRSRRTERFLPEEEYLRLGEEGFTVRTVGKTLVIAGGRKKGTLYGVYDFLERELGCRKYSAKVMLFPKRATILLPPVDRTRVPFFTHREIHYLNAMDQGYADWNKLHSLADRNREWGMWVHTFDRLVPADSHFAAHPEYYSLVGGRRIPSGQLCLTNPGVYPALTAALRKMIAEKPEARCWSVSQNDNVNECGCDACRRSNERYRGSAGTMLAFVSRVARDFPEKEISMLAYEYTRAAPAGITPERNVNIMLCSIECNRSRPLDADPRNASFVRDVSDWGRLTENILLWDYVVQFSNIVSPFPNLRVLQPNIRFFRDSNVRMMFQQGCGANVGEFGELRTYLIAKLLWDPDVNVDSVMDDFLDGYYGPAGRHIRRYIDTMHDALERANPVLYIFGHPYEGIGSYLSPEMLREYTRIFDEAERSVAHLPAIVERVRIARLPLEYAILEISLRDVNADLSYFDKSHAGWRVKPEMRKRLDRFVERAKRAGIRRLEERGTSPDEYRRSIEQQMRVSVKGNLAFGKPVTLLTPHSEKYPVGGGKALTDGLHGPDDFHCNWLGFEGGHMDAVIDLGAVRKIRSIETRFLQRWYSWIWLPRKVDFLLSSDGEHYSSAAEIPNTVSDRADGMFSKAFSARVGGQPARYVRVKAASILTVPDWHIGAGGKAWIFIDEVVVK